MTAAARQRKPPQTVIEAARQDHPVNAEFYGVAAGEEISRHVGHRDGDKPQAVFHGRALQHIHHDVRRAAEEGEEDAEVKPRVSV